MSSLLSRFHINVVQGFLYSSRPFLKCPPPVVKVGLVIVLEGPSPDRRRGRSGVKG